MSSVHWHLVLNHIPVLAVPFGLALLIWGMWRKSTEIKKLSLTVFIASAVITWPTHYTGRESSMEVTDTSDATSGFVILHEHYADISFIALGVLGLISLSVLIIGRGSKPLPLWLLLVVMLAAAAISALLAQTANLGGQVRHPEIRSEGSSAAAVKRVKEIEE